MAYRNRYQITPNPTTINIDFNDYLIQQSTVKYLLGLFTNSSTTTKALVRDGVDGNPLLVSYAGNNVANALRYDYDFDLTFKTPQIISGKFIFNFTMSAVGNGGTITGSCYTTINIYRVTAGGTEVLMGTLTSATLSENTSTPRYDRVAMELDISQTPFAINEKLRINAQFYTAHGGVGISTCNLYLDPSNTLVGTTYDSDFAVYTPFKPPFA